jgi:hypothetical protein
MILVETRPCCKIGFLEDFLVSVEKCVESLFVYLCRKHSVARSFEVNGSA